MVNSGSVPVTLTFTTDDGNPATAITITSGLSALPGGWSGPASFSCASASMGAGCQLTLTYAPTANGSGTVMLAYGFDDDSGTAKTGTASIAFASIAGFLYLTDTVSNVVRCAVSGVDGSLSSCANAATGFSAPTGIVFSGNWAYVTPGAVATDVDVCPVNADGTLGACTSAQTFTTPTALAVSGGYLYVADANGPGYAYSCTIDSATGGLSACIANPIGTVNTLDGIAVTATEAYLVDINGESLSTCAVSSIDGSLSACAQQTLKHHPRRRQYPEFFAAQRIGLWRQSLHRHEGRSPDPADCRRRHGDRGLPVLAHDRDLVHRRHRIGSNPSDRICLQQWLCVCRRFRQRRWNRDLHDRSVRPIGQLPDQPELDRILRRGCGPLTPEWQIASKTI